MRILSATIVLMILMLVSIAGAVDYDGMVIGREETPAIDGDLSDWPQDADITLFPVDYVHSAWGAPTGPEDFTMTWKGFYNPAVNRLYVGIERIDDIRVPYSEMVDDEYWFNDFIEIYVDGNDNGGAGIGSPEERQEYHFPLDLPTATETPLPAWIITDDGPRINIGNTEWAVVEDGTNASYEFALEIWDTYTQNGGEPEITVITLIEGVRIGFDICSPDRDDPAFGGSSNSSFLQWTSAESKWESAENFGKLYLGELHLAPSPSPTDLPHSIENWQMF